MSEWAEMLQEQIQAGASKSDIIELLKEYEKQALRTPDAEGQSEQLNCEHEWKVESFDCYGMPYEKYCEHCGKKEAI